jgi:ribonuclease VapC
MTVVLDASAMLAVLLEEPGRDRVLAVMGGALIASVNWSEVVARLVGRAASDTQIAAAAGLMAGRIEGFGVQEADLAGRLIARTRPLGLSLGDRCCLAFGMLRKATVLTADRAWAGLDLGISIEVIR